MSYVNTVGEWGSNSLSLDRYSFFWSWIFQYAQDTNTPHFAIAFPAFFTLVFIYISVSLILKHDKRKISDALTLYALWPFFYLGTFSMIRQGLAISIGLIMLYCAIRRKYLLFFSLLFINYFIHPSSVVCILFLVFAINNFRIGIKYIILLVLGAFIVFKSLDLILGNTPLSIYGTYLSDSDSYGHKLSILLGIILIPLFLLRRKCVGTDYYVNVGLTDVTIVAFLILIMTFTIVSNAVISRVVDYFSILLILIAPNIGIIFKNKKQGKNLVMAFMTCVFFVYLFITMPSGTPDLKSSAYVPYRFIFLK